MAGLSRAQPTRLRTIYQEGEGVKPKPYRRCRFTQRYAPEDIAISSGGHGTSSASATKKILQRAYFDFRQAPYERMAKLSGGPVVPAAAGSVSADTVPRRW